MSVNNPPRNFGRELIEWSKQYQMKEFGMGEKSFYVVWGFKNTPPTVKHPTLEKAQEEAMRLSEKEGGLAFYVCKAVSVAKQRVEPSRIFSLED